MVTIYHNPRCTKSRQTLELLHARGIEPQVIQYLDTPPDAATLRELLRKLGIEARQLVRKGEPEYQSAGLDRADCTEAQLIAAMVAHPRLIERPIVVAGARAAIGRPPENVLEIL
ncbi:MAG: arsenate reductase (glutaredoxin) [Gammaproteobacteria bacterium]|nr:arsenate reductase (glutaredoxin) [Gammaproteobacteria bacterium]MBK8131857.1 arsenate reductase (glutaredoxin) [Gammaproteobacteria bacterium]MBK9425874.1 arsenate reductase (glutaredoxin) [Gammaproteobacteria bacterium]